jgi:hypothetical protein
VAGAENWAWAKYGAAMIGCTHGMARAASARTTRASFSAAATAVAPSPAICADAISECTLCG